jgi:hypothetical protein
MTRRYLAMKPLTTFPRRGMDRHGLGIALARHADSGYGAESIMWQPEPNFRRVGDVGILYCITGGRGARNPKSNQANNTYCAAFKYWFIITKVP